MNSKITRKLIGYFIVIILIFSLLSGLVFLYLGQKNIEAMAVDNAEVKAVQIANSISSAMDSYNDNLARIEEQDKAREVRQENSGQEDSPGRGRGRNEDKNKQRNPDRKGRNSPGQSFLTWMNELLATNIQIVDKDEKWVEYGLDKDPIDFDNLDEREKVIVEDAFAGNTSSISSISLRNPNSNILVAPPLTDSEGLITGALLLNEPTSLSADYFQSAMVIFLISTLTGIILIIGFSILFANSFLRPLKKIYNTTMTMTTGNYDVQTNVSQDDEIGSLALCVDTLAERLAEAKEESQALDELRDDFISSMSHELKTPVTVIKSSLEALNMGIITDPDEVKEYHEILYDESTVLEKLIQDLTELNILRNKKFSINKNQVNLIEILNDAIRSQGLLAKEKNVTVNKKLSTNFIDYHGDYTRLRQMFITVINNAIKYSKENSEILIEEYEKAGNNYILIRNFGKEISKETQDHIFEPFYRDKNNSEKGFGLGLAIAKEIADLHGIEISIASGGGKTSFIFKVN